MNVYLVWVLNDDDQWVVETARSSREAAEDYAFEHMNNYDSAVTVTTIEQVTPPE